MGQIRLNAMHRLRKKDPKPKVSRTSFALNSAVETVRGRIAVPGVSGGGTVLCENGRGVAVKNGFLTDDFSPNGVHVYKLK